MYIPVLFPVSLVISDDSSLVSVRLADSWSCNLRIFLRNSDDESLSRERFLDDSLSRERFLDFPMMEKTSEIAFKLLENSYLW